MQTEEEPDLIGELGAVGYIAQLTDTGKPNRNRIPLGFPIPKGEPMTPYRDRLQADEYQDKNTPAAKPKRKTKRSQAKRTKKS